MTNPIKLLEEGVALVHEIMKGPAVPEELRLKLVAWRDEAEEEIAQQEAL